MKLDNYSRESMKALDRFEYYGKRDVTKRVCLALQQPQRLWHTFNDGQLARDWKFEDLHE